MAGKCSRWHTGGRQGSRRQAAGGRRQAAGVGTQDSHLNSSKKQESAPRTVCETLKPQSLPLVTQLPPTKPHPLNVPKQCHQLGPSIQMAETRGTFVIQTTTVSLEEDKEEERNYFSFLVSFKSISPVLTADQKHKDTSPNTKKLFS